MSKQRVKGTRWESQVVGLLNERGIPAERRALAGSEDKGDVINFPLTVIECKDVKQFSLSTFVDELTIEKINAADPYGFVALKRPRKPVGQGYAILSIDDMITTLLQIPAIRERLGL